MAKIFKRMSCSEKRAFIEKQILLGDLSTFCINSDLSENSFRKQEVIDNSISRVVDCDCVFEEDGKQLYVADELEMEEKIQEFMNRYSAEQAEEFAEEFAMSDN